MNCPRVLIAAPKSGSGKTLITCALLQALHERSIRPVSFKCGPDYIDPMFHRTVLGIPSENLDTWFAGEDGVREILTESMEHCRGQLAVMEGVMGLFDGVGGTGEEGSAYHLAEVTGTPIILVMDVHGMGRTMIPLLAGILAYDRGKLIRGIILNRTSAAFFATMKPLLEKELPVPVLGFFPDRKDLHFSSRHLGLQLPEEIADLQGQLHLAAELMADSVDLDKLLAIAWEAEAIGGEAKAASRAKTGPALVRSGEEGNCGTSLRLAVARDEAFCFYYAANLRELVKRGVELIDFSPLRDAALPANADGLLLGGGYPELYAKELSENTSMRESIQRAISEGLPSLAECGGFMYLHKTLTDEKGRSWPMCQVVDAEVTWKGRLVRFGYAELEEKTPYYLPEGANVKAHEFHYYDSSDNGDRCQAKKPGKGIRWDCMHMGEDHLWGFPHLYYPSAPQLVDSFVRAMIQKKQKRQKAGREK